MTKVIERILNLLAFLLTAERPVSADEIRYTVAGYGQDSDETFRRMFERDKDLLRSLGIPLQMAATDHWEVEFGYVVPPEEYAIDDPGLTDGELTALGLAAHAVRVGSVAPGPAALFKLGGAPAAGGGDLLAADLGTDAETVAEVFAAVQQRRRLQFDYRGRTRRVEPYGLVHRRGHWYVLGPEGGADDARAFRLDRVSGLVTGDAPGAFTRPPGFSAAEALSTMPWEAGSEDVAATVVFDPDIAWWARRQLGGAASVRDNTDGSLTAEIAVANKEAFFGWLIGFDDHAVVTAPAGLRAEFVSFIEGAP
jgi:proteasome accessory factor B